MHPVLEGIIQQGNVASAYLLVGPPESNKTEDAWAFAQKLSPKEVDLIKINADGASIKIEQVREVQRMIAYGPTLSDYLTVLFEQADLLTTEAATALLKTLEEPPARVVFILVVDREDRLPPTVVSRCQKIVFGERFKIWKPRSEWEEYYQKLENLLGPYFSVNAAFEFAENLYREDKLEDLLYDLVYFIKEKRGKIKEARIWLEAVKNIKKKANPKLALGVAALRMNGTWKNSN